MRGRVQREESLGGRASDRARFESRTDGARETMRECVTTLSERQHAYGIFNFF